MRPLQSHEVALLLHAPTPLTQCLPVDSMCFHVTDAEGQESGNGRAFKLLETASIEDLLPVFNPFRLTRKAHELTFERVHSVSSLSRKIMLNRSRRCLIRSWSMLYNVRGLIRLC